MFGKFRLIPLIAVLILAAMPVSADGLSDSVLSQLRQQGYNEVEMSRTWLGRTRIVARRDGERREIIINPRTGEILRDFWTHEDDDSNAQILSVPSNGGPGGGPDGGAGSGGDHGDSDNGGDSDGGDSDGGDSDGGGDSGDGGEGEGDSGGDD